MTERQMKTSEQWRPISELKPVLWKTYVVCWAGRGWGIAMWKTNARLDDKPYLTDEQRNELRKYRQPYFGDPVESDDYDMAIPENAPTHYVELSDPPDGNSS